MASLPRTPTVIFEGVEYPALAMRTEVVPYAQAENWRYYRPPVCVWLQTPQGWQNMGECIVRVEDDTFYIERAGPVFATNREGGSEDAGGQDV
jgi:hypothetical protein